MTGVEGRGHTVIVEADTALPGTSEYASVNGVQLHYRAAGRGPLVVLLHGFPEFWYAWRHLLPALADAGYRAIAPDLRGYNLSGKPQGVRAYALDVLAEDVAALIHHVGERRAHVIGHDWGGVIAWHLAMRRRELIDHLVVLNAPHPRALRRELRTIRQVIRLAYCAIFQLPRVPEWLISRNDFAIIRRILRGGTVRRNAFTEVDIDRYVSAIARPWALTSALNYYRAALRYRPTRGPGFTSRIDAPTLLIWGERDRYLRAELTEELAEWVPAIGVARIANASHWVHVDARTEVERLVTQFLP